jgi:hypothetical protein
MLSFSYFIKKKTYKKILQVKVVDVHSGAQGIYSAKSDKN